MLIYEAMVQRMLELDKFRGDLSCELGGIAKVIVLAWDDIPARWREDLYSAAVQAAKHFNLVLKRENSPPSWMVALMDLHEKSAQQAT